MLARRLKAATVVIATIALAAAGCSSNKATPVNSRGIALFGADGIMSNSFGSLVKLPGGLGGMSGTAPLMPFTDAFKARLRTIDPTLNDYTYSGQAYDAVMLTALAADVAHSVDGTDMAKYINGLTTVQKGGVDCDSYVDCLNMIKKSRDIAYRGVTVANGFRTAGEPSTATYGTQHFDSSNQIDPQTTEYVDAGDPATASTVAPPPPVDPNARYNGPALTIGLLLPQTGALGAAGKPIFAGARLAIKDINAHGGVLGRQVKVLTQDDGTNVPKATAGAKSLIGQGATAIIGPSFSGAVSAVVPVAVAAGVLVFSPSATSAALSTINDKGLFFRTAPSDILQAQALADVVMRSGAQRVFIVARNDTYGTGLEHDILTALTTGGLPAGDIQTAEYNADGANNTAAYQQIATTIGAFQADSVLLLGYEETADMIAAMYAAHLKLRTSS